MVDSDRLSEVNTNDHIVDEAEDEEEQVLFIRKSLSNKELNTTEFPEGSSDSTEEEQELKTENSVDAEEIVKEESLSEEITTDVQSPTIDKKVENPFGEITMDELDNPFGDNHLIEEKREEVIEDAEVRKTSEEIPQQNETSDIKEEVVDDSAETPIEIIHLVDSDEDHSEENHSEIASEIIETEEPDPYEEEKRAIMIELLYKKRNELVEKQKRINELQVAAVSLEKPAVHDVSVMRQKIDNCFAYGMWFVSNL